MRKDPLTILQINKEMVNSFTIDFQNKTYNFLNLEADSLNTINGYFNILFKGNISMFVKYNKIHILAGGYKNKESFDQSLRIYILKEGVMNRVNNKKSFIDLFPDFKNEIKNFFRTNKLNAGGKNPERFLPVVDFCNNLYQ
jgi:hypothetical protein